MLGDLPARGVQAQLAHASCRGIDRAAGDQRLQAPRRPAPLQRREPARAARHRGEEPRLGRQLRLRSARSSALRTRRAAASSQRISERMPSTWHESAGEGGLDVRQDHRHRQLSAAEKVLTNRDLRTHGRHHRRMDRDAHRHPPAPHRRRRADDERSGPGGGARRRSRPPASAPSELDLIIVATTTPDMIFPSTACILQAKLGMRGLPGVRRAGGVQRLRLRARRPPTSSCAQGSAATRWWSAPRSIRAFSTGTTARTCVLFGDGAGAVVLARATNGPGISRAQLHADGSYARILCGARATSAAAQVRGTPVRARWRATRCSSSR